MSIQMIFVYSSLDLDVMCKIDLSPYRRSHCAIAALPTVTHVALEALKKRPQRSFGKGVRGLGLILT